MAAVRRKNGRSVRFQSEGVDIGKKGKRGVERDSMGENNREAAVFDESKSDFE